jgi:hypothetical protein
MTPSVTGEERHTAEVSASRRDLERLEGGEEGSSRDHAPSATVGQGDPALAISSATPTRKLPRAPKDPWDATRDQSFAADLRLSRALHREAQRVTVRASDLRQVLHDKGLSELSDEIVGRVREAAKRVTGGNCAYADDDLRVLATLAERAVRAGLTEGFSPSIQKNMARAVSALVAEQDDGTGRDPSPPVNADAVPGTNPESTALLEELKAKTEALERIADDDGVAQTAQPARAIALAALLHAQDQGKDQP